MKSKIKVHKVNSATTSSEKTEDPSFLNFFQKNTESNTVIFQWLEENQKEINDSKADIAGMKSEIKSIKGDINKQSLKNIEIIGIFSAILSFIIIDVNIIKAAENLFSAIILILCTALVLFIFVLLIHNLFSYHEDKNISENEQLNQKISEKFRKNYFYEILVLALVLLIVILLGNIFPGTAFKESYSYRENLDKKFVEQKEELEKINQDAINQINNIKNCVNYSKEVNKDCFK